MTEREDGEVIGREYPAKGVVLSSDMPLILWCTVRARERDVKWVAQQKVMEPLEEIWKEEATKWLVGDFVLMPDHVHFFCCPRLISEGVEVERWTEFWKDRLSKRLREPMWRWQDGLFHTRIRSDAHYQDRLEYLRRNPEEAGLVERWEDWKWRGRVWDLSEHIRSFGEPKDRKDEKGGEPE
jgi:putative transposase